MSTSINTPSFVRPDGPLLDLATKASEILSNEVASQRLPPSDELSVAPASSSKTTSALRENLSQETEENGVQRGAHPNTSDEDEISTISFSASDYVRLGINHPFNRESGKILKRKRTSESELEGSEGKYRILFKDEITNRTD